MQTDNKLLASQLKEELVKLMDGMVAFHSSYPKAELPKPSDDFKLTRELLTKGEFNLAVCGKVKNGKSSLINALIGKELLPVCNDVATSRVFKISNAEKDEFYVVYANGNRKEIRQDELSLYGSQAIIDREGEKEINESISYIQVYTPIDFLPEGVSLIDTPGIGSTYPQHTAITKQYLKMADAAMFVMNPTPLENIEVDFLKEVVKVTPGIIFVTTKIDQNGNDSVIESMKRNKQIIEKAIGDDLPFDISILKMSSTLLLEAGKSADEVSANFNYEISGYSDVKTAIVDMVFIILGYYRAGLAYNTSVEHYKEIINALKLRQDTIKKVSFEYEKLLSSYENALKNFNKTMGDSRRKEVLAKIEIILKTMETDFNQIFSSKGSVFSKYNDDINLLTPENVTIYGEDLGDRILADIQQEWNNLTTLVQTRVCEVLTGFNNDCIVSIPDGLISITKEGIEDLSIQDVQLRDRVGKMRNEMFLGTAITGALSTVVGGAYFFLPALVTPALPIIAPVMIVLGLGSVLWGAISGNKKAKEEALHKNKTQLVKFTSDTIANCRKQLVEVSLAYNKYQSLYQGFLLAVREQANSSVASIYDKYNAELEAMKKTVVESKQNPQLPAALEHLVKQWSENKTIIRSIHDKLETLKPE